VQLLVKKDPCPAFCSSGLNEGKADFAKRVGRVISSNHYRSIEGSRPNMLEYVPKFGTWETTRLLHVDRNRAEESTSLFFSVYGK